MTFEPPGSYNNGFFLRISSVSINALKFMSGI